MFVCLYFVELLSPIHYAKPCAGGSGDWDARCGEKTGGTLLGAQAWEMNSISRGVMSGVKGGVKKSGQVG